MRSSIVYERFLWFEQQAKALRYPNARTLAAEFEISEKTAQRNIAFMRDRLGCPVEYDQQRKGYYYTDQAFSLSGITLSSADLMALIIARDLLRNVAGRTIGSNISHAVEKIAATLTTHGAGSIGAGQTISLRFIEQSPVKEHIFKTILEGCLKQRSLELVYDSPARPGSTRRTVDPYHLYNYMGNWHLLARCHLRNEYRNFHLSRVSAAHLLKAPFVLKKGFDPDRYFASSFGIFKAWETQTVTLRFSPEKVRWIAGQIWHPHQKEMRRKDGSLDISFPAAAFPELLMEVLKHGAGVEVVKPKELRDMVRAEAKKIHDLYKTA
jgi:predicted DNA-binding transcriptional regulator YafY